MAGGRAGETWTWRLNRLCGFREQAGGCLGRDVGAKNSFILTDS